MTISRPEAKYSSVATNRETTEMQTQISLIHTIKSSDIDIELHLSIYDRTVEIEYGEFVETKERLNSIKAHALLSDKEWVEIQCKAVDQAS